MSSAYTNRLRASGTGASLVVGMSDGLVVPFTLVCGLQAAGAAQHLIVSSGLIATGAGALAMAIGGYFTMRTEAAGLSGEKGNTYSGSSIPGQGLQDAAKIVAGLGLGQQTQAALKEDMKPEENAWLQQMGDNALSSPAELPGALRTALAIGTGYVMGGLVPVAPYWITMDTVLAFRWACLITVVALFVFGWIRAVLSERPALPAAVRAVIFGGAAAAAAFLIGGLLD